jgi:hypothetical protein
MPSSVASIAEAASSTTDDGSDVKDSSLSLGVCVGCGKPASKLLAPSLFHMRQR